MCWVCVCVCVRLVWSTRESKCVWQPVSERWPCVTDGCLILWREKEIWVMSLCVCVCHCLCPEAKISQQNAVNYACVPAELTGTEPPHACMCVCICEQSVSVCSGHRWANFTADVCVWSLSSDGEQLSWRPVSTRPVMCPMCIVVIPCNAFINIISHLFISSLFF